LPVGIGINLVQPAFQMQVKNVEPGSPAAATGKLKPGQIILRRKK
jgi:C-terminal processing protease CtpA/Prc